MLLLYPVHVILEIIDIVEIVERLVFFSEGKELFLDLYGVPFVLIALGHLITLLLMFLKHTFRPFFSLNLKKGPVLGFGMVPCIVLPHLHLGELPSFQGRIFSLFVNLGISQEGIVKLDEVSSLKFLKVFGVNTVQTCACLVPA